MGFFLVDGSIRLKNRMKKPREDGLNSFSKSIVIFGMKLNFQTEKEFKCLMSERQQLTITHQN